MNNLFEQEIQENALTEQIRRLNKVIIQNYRNIEYKEYSLDRNSLILEGKNGLGKTNVLEAVFWALSGNLFNGTAKTESQEIIPNNAQKDTIISVRLEFDKDHFNFERRVEQKWSKENVYKGTETKLLVNGAVSKDQNIAITALLNYLGFDTLSNNFSTIPDLSKLNLFELIYNANSLRTLDYKIIRAIIINMVGDVDFKTIINANQSKYKYLVDPLKAHGLDIAALKTNTRSKIFDKNNGLEQQAKTMAAIIEEYEREGAKITDPIELQNAKSEIEKIDNGISKLEKEKNLSPDDAIKNVENKIAEIKNKIYERQGELRTQYQANIAEMSKNSKENILTKKRESLSGLREKRITINGQISDKELEKSQVQGTLNLKNQELGIAKTKLDELVKEWKKLKNPELSGQIITCPNCNTEFDISLSKESKDIIQQKFNNVDVEGRKETKNVNGLKEGIGILEDNIEIINSSILKLQGERDQLDKNIKSLELEITNLQIEIDKEKSIIPPLDLENDKIIIDHRATISSLTTSKNSLVFNQSSHIQDINTKISNLVDSKKPYEMVVNSDVTASSYQANAEKKRKELKVLQDELQKQNDIILLIKDLEKEMFEKLDERIGKAFGDNVQFKLWKMNVTDGSYDTRLCETYVRDDYNRFVNIKTINTGMFPVRATEIISKIKDHYLIPKSFIFVDEVSSLDNEHIEMLKKFNEQIFATKVSQSNTIQERRF